MKILRLLVVMASMPILSLLWSCEAEQGPMDCSVSDLSLNISSVNNASGCTTSDGSVSLSATGGFAPYQYKINGGALQSSPEFENLAPGNYTATVIDDNNCESTVDFQVLQGASSLAFNSSPTATESGCETSNATITVDATGEGDLQYRLDNGDFVSSNSFDNVSAGLHTITIKDQTGCTTTAEVTVLTGVSFENSINPIIMANCAVSGCHDGSLGESRNWTIFSNVQNKASTIKTRTGNGSMPPAGSGKSLTQEQIDLIACWVDDGAMNN